MATTGFSCGPLAVVILLFSFLISTEGRPRYSPLINYVASPDQLTLLYGANLYRFAYVAPNQFRAERRHLNGTVEGYYGYIGADNKPVRVRYTSVENQGFQANLEQIPEEFPIDETQEVVPESAPPPAGAENVPVNDPSVVLLPSPGLIVSNEKNSISIDAAQIK